MASIPNKEISSQSGGELIASKLPPARRSILIARHAESEWNARGILQGHDGPGLNERGKGQAKALGSEIAKRFPKVQHVICSDLDRASETAQCICDALSIASPKLEERLREANIGFWSGKTLQEVAKSDPKGLRSWLVGTDIRRGGGETKEEMLYRALAAIGDGVASHPEEGADAPIVFVTHGGPIRLTVAALLGLFPNNYRPVETVLHTSITLLEVDSASATGIAGRLVSYNETSHVAGLLGPAIPNTAQEQNA